MVLIQNTCCVDVIHSAVLKQRVYKNVTFSEESPPDAFFNKNNVYPKTTVNKSGKYIQ